MMTGFLKMHGLGNDFVVVDERVHRHDLTPARIAALSDRHTGIGCDQFVTLRPACAEGADVFVRFFNADGSESGACGNASRCVADLLARETGQDHVGLQTRAGVLHATLIRPGLVTVDMGTPAQKWTDVPLAEEMDTLRLPIAGDPAAVSMGNPHATFFMSSADAVDPCVAGPELEHHPLFPERANIGFAHVTGRDAMRLRVWERGSGLTRACGSGACAAVVNAVRRGLVERTCTVVMDGGELTITWRESDGHVLMTGPATTSFTGAFNPEDYPR
ncbi:diaminopimelate epimerase [Komagataeibacter swingsii]|uniref:Diaminopimelate epimerase n=1 Tax=Komagataeibacter swingsii TaxID=215220 RepID=A0A850NX32_9PROT|nr:diaminopimelate epimerase [Komagataeibacter swingsii]NVN35503.1 diaminopimelate epimerase [Komagataeibacter swingsii]RFP04813.1 diaminopimelate epimerase [Komagataeibacter xylinus]RFP07299.1 diaminopimelate epimerase [Komagataeibacter xylinus]